MGRIKLMIVDLSATHKQFWRQVLGKGFILRFRGGKFVLFTTYKLAYLGWMWIYWTTRSRDSNALTKKIETHLFVFL
jgi:hypothetical protein